MKQIEAGAKVPETITGNKKKFKGYSIEDIRYQRALIALRREFCKSKLNHSAKKISSFSPFGQPSKKQSKWSSIGLVAQKLLGGVSYLEYAMVGFSIFNSGRKIFSLFRRHK